MFGNAISRTGSLLQARAHQIPVQPGCPCRLLAPVNLPAQRRRAARAMLLESQVDCGDGRPVVGHAVDCEPARQRAAAAPFAVPAQPALDGIVERVAPQIGVVANLQLSAFMTWKSPYHSSLPPTKTDR